MIRNTARAVRPSLSASLLLLAACGAVRPQSGGGSATILGGAVAPTIVTTAAPQNPQTPTTTTVEKTTTREFSEPGLATPAKVATAETAPPAVAPVASVARPLQPSTLLRETTTERATTSTGIAQKDTARDLSVRLANLRGVMWVGLALLIGGPVLGWRLGWFTNGCIAGAVGLLLVILSAVLPGHEAWFGLTGLLLIPLVAYVYYRAHHDANQSAPAK